MLLGASNIIRSQSMVEIDSLSYELCDYLQNRDDQNDTLKINSLYENRFFPYLRTFEETRAELVGRQLFYRLQRNCIDFRELLDRLNPPKEAVNRKMEKPESSISKKELRDFKNQHEFYYYEVAGDTTKVTMKDGIWIDNFSDNTFSRCTYNWLTETEFELVYLESNNETRANFSLKGDRFIYQVISKGENYYTLSLNIPGQEVYEVSKMYFK